MAFLLIVNGARWFVDVPYRSFYGRLAPGRLRLSRQVQNLTSQVSDTNRTPAPHLFYHDYGVIMTFLPVKICEELLCGNALQRENGVLMLKAMAQIGHASAHMSLGIHYQEGQFIPKNLMMARFHYQEAARLGSGAGARNLAILYQTYPLYDDDSAKAVGLYEQAANNGDAIAAHNLGILYQAGQGVEQNHFQAKSWYDKAVKLGHQGAKTRISELTLTKIEPKGSASKRTDKKSLKASLKPSRNVYEARRMPKMVFKSEHRNFHEWNQRARPNSLWGRLKGQGYWL